MDWGSSAFMMILHWRVRRKTSGLAESFAQTFTTNYTWFLWSSWDHLLCLCVCLCLEGCGGDFLHHCADHSFENRSFLWRSPQGNTLLPEPFLANDRHPSWQFQSRWGYGYAWFHSCLCLLLRPSYPQSCLWTWKECLSSLWMSFCCGRPTRLTW